MKSIKILLAAVIVSASSLAFGANRNAEIKANPAETKTSSETKTQAVLYWFDANTGEYIGHTESSGCDQSTSQPCAKGYLNVANPSNPQQPATAPFLTDTGERP